MQSPDHLTPFTHVRSRQAHESSFSSFSDGDSFDTSTALEGVAGEGVEGETGRRCFLQRIPVDEIHKIQLVSFVAVIHIMDPLGERFHVPDFVFVDRGTIYGHYEVNERIKSSRTLSELLDGEPYAPACRRACVRALARLCVVVFLLLCW